ncbi:MAG: MFS transporter [Acidobacteriaceae bacterium]|nr:MFS transporter [Acidobacteriaceae bacterium]
MAYRHRLVLLALVINMVCYTDRVCIAIAGPELRTSFGLSAAQMGLVFSIFSLSYFLGQTPWGILADRYGSRGLVAFAIAGWSVFTALTAAAWSYVSLLVIRFVFGALEAAFSPSIASAFSRWIPIQERATAFGAFLGGGRLGGALAPPLAGFFVLRYGWQAPFLIFGAFGLLWAAAWFAFYRNQPPADAPRRNEPIPWAVLLRSRRLWCLLGTAFGSTFLWQFYITWFPTYLREQRGMAITEASYYAGLPLLFGVAATWAGGLATDLLARRLGDRRARTVLGFVSLSAGAALFTAGVWHPAPALGALLMASAAGGVDLYLGAAWSSATDIGETSGGAVSGLMNAASNAAGFASPAIMGLVLDRFHDWNAVLYLSAASTLAAAVLWLFVNPRRIA